MAILIFGCADGGRNNEESIAVTDESESDTAAIADRTPADQAAGADGAAVTDDTAPVVVFLGTSLTAGYGLSPDQAFPALIQSLSEESDPPVRVVNAGVSGETSAGALRRIDWLLRQPFDVLVIETGANDMLRGTDADATEANIQAIVDQVRGRYPDAPIILAGMLAMPNLGPDYAARFEPIYPRLAERNDLILIPFLLEGVAGDPTLNQVDGIHPNARGQRIVANTVWESLGPVLRGLPR